MTVLSLLRGSRADLQNLRIILANSLKSPSNARNFSVGKSLRMPLGEDWKVPSMSKFVITPSRYQWQKTKDHLHYYLMLGLIPACLVTFLANVFIGPATLEEIPEGYTPKEWEYHKSPISRFFAKYFFTTMQQDYERNMFYLMEEEEKRKMRLLSWKVERLMRERGDYPGYVWQPTTIGKYVRKLQEDSADIEYSRGTGTIDRIPGGTMGFSKD